jgi:hypothetical protein
MYVNQTLCHPDVEPCTHCGDTCGDCYGYTGGCAFVVVPYPVGTGESSSQFGGLAGRLRAVPNPFTGSTEISFSMLGRAETEVTVYDPAGRKVRMLYAGVLESGEIRLTWDGRDAMCRVARPGPYFVLVKTGDRTLARKVTILR